MEEKILAILKEIKPGVDFENKTSLIDDGILESFDIIQIVTTIMDEFDVQILANDIEPENFNSFKAICDLVKSKCS